MSRKAVVYAYPDDNVEYPSDFEDDEQEQTTQQQRDVIAHEAAAAALRNSGMGAPTTPRGSAIVHAEEGARAQTEEPVVVTDRLAEKIRSEQQLASSHDDLSGLSYDGLHLLLEPVFSLYTLIDNLQNFFKIKENEEEVLIKLSSINCLPVNNQANEMKKNLNTLYENILSNLEPRERLKARLTVRRLLSILLDGQNNVNSVWIYRRWSILENTPQEGQAISFARLYQFFKNELVQMVDQPPQPNIPGLHYSVLYLNRFWIFPVRDPSHRSEMQIFAEAEPKLNGSTGWKVHLAVNEDIPGNLEAAFNATIKIVHETGIPGLKVLRRGNTITGCNWPEQYGKQITIYFGSNAFVTAFRNNIIIFLSQLAQALGDLKIVQEVRSHADKPFPDPYQIMSYRNDQDQIGDYVSASLDPSVIDTYPTRCVWNPGGHHDPFPEIIARMQKPSLIISTSNVRLGAGNIRALTGQVVEDRSTIVNYNIGSGVVEQHAP